MEKIIVFLMTTLLFYLKKAAEIINPVTTYRVILSIVKNTIESVGEYGNIFTI